MNIIYSKPAIKALLKVDVVSSQRIRAAINRIPYGDIRPLEETENTCRLRVGDWRVLFVKIGNDTIHVKRIAPRGDAYKRV